MSVLSPSLVAVVLAAVVGLGYAGLLAVQIVRVTGWSRRVVGSALGLVVVAGIVLGRFQGTAPIAAAIRDGSVGWWGGMVACAALLALLLRYAARLDWVRSLLVAEALALVGTVSWLPKAGAPTWADPNVPQAVWCFTTPWRWGTYGRLGVWFDVVPNIVLYAPVGVALAFALRNRWVAIVVASLVSFGTEAYQALFTDRECAGNDVLANAAGALAGVIAVLVLELLAPRPTAYPAVRAAEPTA